MVCRWYTVSWKLHTKPFCFSSGRYACNYSYIIILYPDIGFGLVFIWQILFFLYDYILHIFVNGAPRVAQWVRSLDLTAHTSLSPIRRGFAPGFESYKKECTRLAAASNKVYQLLAHGRWFSPASFFTKTGRHDIAEILLNTKHQNSNSNSTLKKTNLLLELFAAGLH